MYDLVFVLLTHDDSYYKNNSVFEHSKLDLLTWAMCLSLYDADIIVTDAAKVLPHHRKSIITVYARLNAEVEEYMNYHPVTFSGANPTQIDELYIGSKRKYNRGAYRKFQRNGKWIFGIWEQHTGKVFACVVPDRSHTTLQRIIEVKLYTYNIPLIA